MSSLEKVEFTQVGIIGAGFGGISAAKVLCRSRRVRIHIIDRRNHHLFQPLLYQVAMAGLNPADIAIPIRRLFSGKKNVEVTLAEVDEIDLQNCAISFDGKSKRFDYLVLACGAKHFYFGNDDWELLAPGLKNIEQATEIRRRILTAFEMAEKEENPERQKAYLTFAVVGGGPTGVELAGAISEMARSTLKNDYRNADLSETKVFLIEGGQRVLATFPESLSKRAERDLQRMGVTVLTNTIAQSLSADGLQAGERWIPTKTIIWAAGVKPSSLIGKIEERKDRQGRLVVKQDMSIPTNSKIFAIGDIASFETETGATLPGIAPVAIQQGKFVGNLILNELKGKGRKRFHYWDKGVMATIGRSRAVVKSGRLQLTGFIAWIAWVLIHILYLMRFKNRVFVFFQWAWAYFRFGQGARLIVHKTWRFYAGKKINYSE